MTTSFRLLVPLVLSSVFLTGCPSAPPRVASAPVDVIEIASLARQLGLEVARDSASDMVILSGARGTIVFNPRLNGILVGERVCFRGHRVAIANGRVTVPPGFLAECEKLLMARKPQPPRQPVGPPGGRFHVVLDPGHGGQDPGAIGVSGRYEKTVNLAVASLVAAELGAKGIRVTMTRTRDNFVELEERAAIGNRLRADAFVAIHADARPGGNRSVDGYTVFVVHTSYSDSSRASMVADEYNLDLSEYNGGRSASSGRRLEIIRSILAANRVRSQRLAALIRSQMHDATDSPDHGTQLGELRVLKLSVCPAVLVELGFMTNPAEEQMLFEPGYQQTLASAVARGIALFLEGS